MRTTTINSFCLLAVVAVAAVEIERGSVRGRGKSVPAEVERLHDEISKAEIRILSDDASSYSDPTMFVLRDDKQGGGRYCLTYEKTGEVVHPDKDNETILGLKASRCDASDEKQHWVLDTSRKRAPIRPMKDLNLCIENVDGKLGYNSARLSKCDKDKVQKMRIAEQGSNEGAIQTINDEGWGRSLALSPDYYYCRDDQYRVFFERNEPVALWDKIHPDDYKEPPPPEIKDVGGAKRVLVVSEYDTAKCVGAGDLEMEECDEDNDMLVWFTDGKKVWSPKSGRIYSYSWNRGIARNSCCLSHSEYWYDGKNVGPLFEFADECESSEFEQGFLLVPVDQYKNGTPKKPTDVKTEDYVQLQVAGACLQSNESKRWHDTEMEVSECYTDKYGVQDEQLWYVDGNIDGGSFRLRSKKDLTLCLDFGINWDRSGEDGYKAPRLVRCDDYSSRQEWRYNKRGMSEISHAKVTGYMDRTFCVESDKTCRYDSCEDDDPDWYWENKLRIVGCNGSDGQSWNLIKNDKCAREVPPREQYPKRDYFLFVSREDSDSCWERDVTENMGLLNGGCHMTIPRRHYSQIFYFEEVDGAAVKIKMRKDEAVCMGLQNDKFKNGACIDMTQGCESENSNQEWLYNSQTGEISPANNEELCVSSNCSEQCSRETCGCCDCGEFCLKKCNGKTNQAFDIMSVPDYRMEYDYGKGIDADDIVMVVLREDSKYCIKAYDSLELQDVVVAKCKVQNAEQHWTFEREDKGMRWRSVENPHLFIESVQNNEGKKLILNEDMISKNKQHWVLEDDGTIRPAPKNQLCITRDNCKGGSPAKNDNVELTECKSSKNRPRMEFDLVRPSEYSKFLRDAAIAYSRNDNDGE